MTWTVLPSYSDGNALTAAQLTAIKDNINESAAAKATTAGRWFIATGTNSLAERAISSDINLAQQTTTSTTYVNLSSVGATVTVTTGATALVMIQCQMFNSSTGSCWSSYDITGASGQGPSDQWAITCEGGVASQSFKFGNTTLHGSLSGAGPNTFTQKYRVGSNTGTFDDRHLIVMAL